jgi:hypothetical protein
VKIESTTVGNLGSLLPNDSTKLNKKKLLKTFYLLKGTLNLTSINDPKLLAVAKSLAKKGKYVK